MSDLSRCLESLESAIAQTLKELGDEITLEEAKRTLELNFIQGLITCSDETTRHAYLEDSSEPEDWLQEPEVAI